MTTAVESNVTEGEGAGGLSIKKIMNNLPAKLQTSSLSLRVQLLADLTQIVQPQYKDVDGGVPLEAIVKAICKILPQAVLPRYKDSTSRRSVLKLVEVSSKTAKTT